MTLCELSRRTRIKQPLLEALEQGEMEKLPRGPFRRGFARAYAVEVGLDAERLLAHFPSEAASSEAPVPSPPSEHVASGEFIRRLVISATLVAVAIIVPRWIIHSTQEAPAAPAAAQETAGTAGVQPDDGTPPPATRVRTEPQAAAVAAGAVTVVLRAVDEVWIQADVDGQRVAYGLIPAGTEKTFTARRALSIRVGDAGAVQYTVNGVAGAPLGPRGFVRDLHLSAPSPPPL